MKIKRSTFLDAWLVIANNVIESFNGVMVLLLIVLWLTLDFLPKTRLDPPATISLYLALVGLVVLAVFARSGQVADKFVPHKVAELSQYLNIASMVLFAAILTFASPRYPLLVLAIMAMLQLMFTNRDILFDSAVMVIISSRVPEERQSEFFTWNFRANLVVPLTAPIVGTWLFEHNKYLAIGVCTLLSLASAALLSWTRRKWVPRDTFNEKPDISLRAYIREFSRKLDKKEKDFRGFKAFKHLNFAGIILFIMAAEALGNRSREAYDVFFVTETFHQPATSFGLISVFMFIGTVLGTSLKSVIASRWKQWWWPVAFYVVFALSFLSRGLAPNVLLFLLAGGVNGFAAGFSGGIFEVAWVSNTTKEHLGAVSAAKSAYFTIVSTGGYLIWAVFAWWGNSVSPTFMADYGYRIACVIGGGFILIAAVSSIRLYRHVDWTGTAEPMSTVTTPETNAEATESTDCI